MPTAKTAKKKKLRPPYIRKIARRGSITIWRVDGAYVRTNLDEEFSDYGHHLTNAYIPKNEFWIDQNAPGEERFFLHHLLVEHRLMAKGVDEETAREKADQAELRMRKKAGDIKRVKKDKQLANASAVHLRLWKKLKEPPVSVWIVKGRLVRSVFDIDFTEGGHEHVYEYIPQNELWIDDQVTDAERPYVLLHELHERGLMENGMNYDRAHDKSSRLEKHYRKHPEELHEALAKEGWE